MLTKWVREYIKKYSFVKDTDFKNGIFYIYYFKGENVKTKKLPYRTTKDQLVRTIENIKKDIDYYKEKQKRVDAGEYDVSFNAEAGFGYSG